MTGGAVDGAAVTGGVTVVEIGGDGASSPSAADGAAVGDVDAVVAGTGGGAGGVLVGRRLRHDGNGRIGRAPVLLAAAGAASERVTAST